MIWLSFTRTTTVFIERRKQCESSHRKKIKIFSEIISTKKNKKIRNQTNLFKDTFAAAQRKTTIETTCATNTTKCGHVQKCIEQQPQCR